MFEDSLVILNAELVLSLLDELLSNRQDSESALDEDILFEILRKSFKQQYKHNIRCCQSH